MFSGFLLGFCTYCRYLVYDFIETMHSNSICIIRDFKTCSYYLGLLIRDEIIEAWLITQKVFYFTSFGLFDGSKKQFPSWIVKLPDKSLLFKFNITSSSILVSLALVVALWITYHESKKTYKVLLSFCVPAAFSLYFKTILILKKQSYTMYGKLGFPSFNEFSESEKLAILLFKSLIILLILFALNDYVFSAANYVIGSFLLSLDFLIIFCLFYLNSHDFRPVSSMLPHLFFEFTFFYCILFFISFIFRRFKKPVIEGIQYFNEQLFTGIESDSHIVL